MPFSIIVPAYNEADGIVETIKRCQRVCGKEDEVVVVDDGSKDQTVSLARAQNVKVVELKTNKGKATALQTGFGAAKNDVLITIDADCTYPPEDIPLLIKSLEHADMVVGSRFTGKKSVHLPLQRQMANQLGARVTSLILGQKITDVTSGLRAFRKEWIHSIPIEAKGLDFEAELTARTVAAGYQYAEVPISVDHRRGQSSLRFWRDTGRFFLAVLRGRKNGKQEKATRLALHSKKSEMQT